MSCDMLSRGRAGTVGGELGQLSKARTVATGGIWSWISILRYCTVAIEL